MLHAHWRAVLALAATVTGLSALAALVLPGAPPNVALAAITEPPVLLSPASGTVLTDFSPTLIWTNPTGTTQYQLQVTPQSDDGPAADLIVAGAGQAFSVPPPPEWYGLLPDMVYT